MSATTTDRSWISETNIGRDLQVSISSWNLLLLNITYSASMLHECGSSDPCLLGTLVLAQILFLVPTLFPRSDRRSCIRTDLLRTVDVLMTPHLEKIGPHA